MCSYSKLFVYYFCNKIQTQKKVTMLIDILKQSQISYGINPLCVQYIFWKYATLYSALILDCLISFNHMSRKPLNFQKVASVHRACTFIRQV